LNERVDALEIYTSDECCLRFIGSPALRLEVIDYGTIRERDRINIFDSKTDDGQAGVTAEEIERRIHALRQLYALTFLLEADRVHDIPVSERLSDIDLEQLLSKDERLRLLATGLGSFWVTLGNFTAAGRRAVIAIAGMFYVDGRRALLQHLRAQAESEELDVQKKKMELEFAKADKTLDLLQRIEKIKDPVLKEKVRFALTQNMQTLGAKGDLEVDRNREADTAKRIGPTD